MKKNDHTSGSTLAMNSIMLIASKIIASVNMIVLFVLMSYTFSPDDYGNFRQVWLINKGLILEIFALGIPVSIFYFLPKISDAQKKIFVVQTSVLLSGIALCASVIMYIFAGPISHVFNNEELVFLLRIFSLYAFFTIPTLAVEGVLISLGKTFQFAVFTFSERTVLLIAGVISILLFKSVVGLCATFVVIAIIKFIASVVMIILNIKDFPLKSKKFEFIKQLKVAIPSGLGNIVGILNIELDKIMIASFFTVSQFARYANGAFDIPFLGTVAAAVNSVMMPEYVRKYHNNDYQGILDLWHASVSRIALAFFPLMIFLFIFAPDFITLMFSEKYVQSVLVFQIYLLALIPKITWYGTILVAMGRPKEPLLGALIALITNIFLNIVFISWFGFIGPAIATVITTYIVAWYYLGRIKKVMGIAWLSVFPWRQLVVTFATAFLIGLIMLPIAHFYHGSKIVKICMSFTFYSVMIYYVFMRLNLIKKEDRVFVTQSLSKIKYMVSRRK